MTCAHVLGLIDAGSLVDQPAPHKENAWAHARRCPACGAALAAAALLREELAGLAAPDPPAHLATAVLARIERLEAGQRSGATGRAAETRARPVRRSEDWGAALAGVAACCVVALSLALGEGPPVDLTSPRIGRIGGLLGAQATGTWWITLAISLVLYLTALFAPLRGEDGRNR